MNRVLIYSGLVLLVGCNAVFSQQKDSQAKKVTADRDKQPHAADVPMTAEDVAKTNPFKPTQEGLAAATKLYGYHCAMCHGKEGDGKGELAAEMKLDLHDWRDPKSIANMTDGELFFVASNGRGKMLGGEGDRQKEEVRWNLVRLIRSFAKKSN
jgi:mono/diheme cytochrome c family protein